MQDIERRSAGVLSSETRYIKSTRSGLPAHRQEARGHPL